MATKTVCQQKPMSLHKLRMCYEAQVIGNRRAMEEVSIADVDGLEAAPNWPDYFERNRDRVQLTPEDAA